mmetsp:Transcript_144542/g.251967  ORF Transcript_144542/g.251967 Transcript_144542/m.251967 type:complete len:111 (-) Transcript_144542:139-471(-)
MKRVRRSREENPSAVPSGTACRADVAAAESSAEAAELGNPAQLCGAHKQCSHQHRGYGTCCKTGDAISSPMGCHRLRSLFAGCKDAAGGCFHGGVTFVLGRLCCVQYFLS